MIIDTHAHIDDSCFDFNREETIDKSKKIGIEKIINPSISTGNFSKVKSIGELFKPVFTAYGIHPLWADTFNQSSIDIIENYIKNDKKAVAIGEIGVDFKYDTPLKNIQINCFKEQVKLAVDLQLPVLIHCRRAVFKVYEILKKYWDKNIPAIMHAYSGSVEMAEKFINLGFFISISGTITYPNAKKPLLIAKKIPMTCLVIETDSPDLTPHKYKGEKNKPFYIKEIIRKIAILKNTSEEKTEEIIYKNTLSIFGK